MMPAKMAFLKRNSMRAKAYPAIEHTMTTRRACRVAAASELANQRSTGLAASWKKRTS